MAKIHVLAKKEELDRHRLPGKVVVVVDLLFATTSMVAVLAHGASEVVPAADGAGARAEAERRPAGSYLLSGERDAVTLPGFYPPTPLALLDRGVSGRALIYATTNGTVALRQASGASRVYAAALLNAAAVVDHLVRTAGDDTVLIACAGSADAFNLEDFYGAGRLVSLLAGRGEGAHELSDAALAARLLHDRSDPLDCLSSSRVGRMMRALGLEREVAFAAQRDLYRVVPELREGRLLPA